jgi:hypothetical protein
LESSLFGILVIQIKPQLEVLLNLPEASLTKEIQLTQDLLELFIKYQIPSDLLSYEGSDTLLPENRTNFVKKQGFFFFLPFLSRLYYNLIYCNE